MTIAAQKNSEGCEEIYDRLLPYLLNSPIEHALQRQRKTSPAPEYRTPQVILTFHTLIFF